MCPDVGSQFIHFNLLKRGWVTSDKREVFSVLLGQYQHALAMGVNPWRPRCTPKTTKYGVMVHNFVRFSIVSVAIITPRKSVALPRL